MTGGGIGSTHLYRLGNSVKGINFLFKIFNSFPIKTTFKIKFSFCCNNAMATKKQELII